MEEYLNKQCKIHVRRDDKNLFYLGVVLKVTDDHVTFLDKFENVFTYRVGDVESVRTY